MREGLFNRAVPCDDCSMLRDIIHDKSVFLFDFDGVITDSEVYAFETLRRLVWEHYGIEAEEEDAAFTIGMDAYGTANAMSSKYGIGLTGERFLELLSGYPNYYTEYEGIRPFPGIDRLFCLLKEQGRCIAIVSSTRKPYLETALERMVLLQYPDAIIGGDTVTNHKPDPEPYLEAMRMLHADPRAAVAIEDSPVGIRAARGAGLPVIAFCGSVMKQDTSLADERIESYDTLIGLLS